jgi:putative ABC transport system substrate-binding protein
MAALAGQLLGEPVKRRELTLGLLAIGIAMATQADAQTVASPLPRVVIIFSAGDKAVFRPFMDRFLHGMQELGHAEGSTFRLEVRAHAEPARSLTLIREVIASRPDVLVVGGLSNARHARDATKTVPVVVATSSDLVDAGIVASFARPGGNITGITDLVDELTVKRLELLHELIPRLSRVALLNNPEFPATSKIEGRVRAAAGTLGITVLPLYAKDRASLALAVDSLEKSRSGALLIGGGPLFVSNAQQIIERATALRVPVAHYWPGTAEMGALFSHQADIHKNWERAAYYVSRILKGAKPSDLPIEQPTRYELVLNRKVATAFGITIPSTVMLRVDRLLE